MKTRRALAIVAGILALSAVPSAPGVANLGLPADLAGYAEWPQLLREPRLVPLALWTRCIPPTSEEWEAARDATGPHARRSIMVYGNESAAASLSGGKGFAPGAILAKEKRPGTADGSPVAVAFMVQRAEAPFATTGGWEFRYYPPSGEARATHEACAGCHRSAATTHYIFGAYPAR